MRIETTERRERLWADLKDALDENTKSGALDQAARFTVRMAGSNRAAEQSRIGELLAAANERGALTGEEIAEILNTREVPVEYESIYVVGEEADIP